MDVQKLIGSHKNLVFIGDAGSGKSEVALNFARWVKSAGDGRECHFFDLDMTKPLFRSRDMEELLKAEGISVHYREQFMDAPTLVGGVNVRMKDENSYVILDVGGDDIGARSIGGFRAELNRADTMVIYVLNAFRPWTDTVEHIDETIGKILNVSHIPLEKLHFMNNTNQGRATTAQDFISGTERLQEMLSPYVNIEFSTVQKELYSEVQAALTTPVYPLELLISYPW